MNMLSSCCSEGTPVPKRKKAKLYSDDPRVAKARQEMEDAYTNFVPEGKQNGGVYVRKKEQLFKVYDEVMAEDLVSKIKAIDDSHTNNQSSKGWGLVRELSGKNSSQPSQIAGETAEDRISSWYIHFKKLLGNLPVLEDQDEEIEPVSRTYR